MAVNLGPFRTLANFQFATFLLVDLYTFSGPDANLRVVLFGIDVDGAQIFRYPEADYLSLGTRENNEGSTGVIADIISPDVYHKVYSKVDDANYYTTGITYFVASKFIDEYPDLAEIRFEFYKDAEPDLTGTEWEGSELNPDIDMTFFSPAGSSKASVVYRTDNPNTDYYITDWGALDYYDGDVAGDLSGELDWTASGHVASFTLPIVMLYQSEYQGQFTFD